MAMPYSLRNVFTRPVTRPIRKAAHRNRPHLEVLEDRMVLSTLSITAALPDPIVWLHRPTATRTMPSGTATVSSETGTSTTPGTGPVAGFAPGEGGQAFSLNTDNEGMPGATPDEGLQQYVRVPYVPAMNYSAGFSADAWINPVALPQPQGPNSPTGGEEIFNQTTEQGQSGDQDIFLVRLMSDGSVACGVHTSDDDPSGSTFWSVQSAAGAVVPGQFTNVGVTFDQATGQFDVYVNGVQTSVTTTGMVNPEGAQQDLKVDHADL